MFFRNLLKKIRQRRPMLANRMGGFLRQRPQLMERMRNLKNMRGLGRKFMMPGMGLASLPMLGDQDVNDLPIPQAGASLDIMPRFRSLPKQPPQVGTAPLMTGGNAALLPADLPPLPSKPMGMPNFMSAGQPPKMVMGMKEGGEAKEYPNEGLAALAKVAPEVVERMGYEEGGPVAGIDMPSGSDADMMNYQNTLMALKQLKANLPPNQLQFFDRAVQEILGESGRTLSNLDRAIALGMPPVGALRSGIARINADMMGKMPSRTIGYRDREIIKEVIPNEMD